MSQQARPVAPPKKKKPPPKMPGAKHGCPQRLLDQCRDYGLIFLVLAVIYLFGTFLDRQQGHGHGHGHEHSDEHHEEHHRLLGSPAAPSHGILPAEHGRSLSGGHHHVDPMLDLQVTFGICFVLITVTVIFETIKHRMEHDCPPMLAKILQAMFGELTVLGFIALFTYMCIKFGVIEMASNKIYHDPEHLLHLFEDIHFMLFFVMIIFLIEAVIFIFATLSSEEVCTTPYLGTTPQPPPLSPAQTTPHSVRERSSKSARRSPQSQERRSHCPPLSPPSLLSTPSPSACPLPPLPSPPSP